MNQTETNKNGQWQRRVVRISFHLIFPPSKAAWSAQKTFVQWHAINIKTLLRGWQREMGQLEVHPLTKDNRQSYDSRSKAPLIDHRVIKSSSGEKEQRPVHSNVTSFGDKLWKVKYTHNRDTIGYRILLGTRSDEMAACWLSRRLCLHGDKNHRSINWVLQRSK